MGHYVTREHGVCVCVCGRRRERQDSVCVCVSSLNAIICNMRIEANLDADAITAIRTVCTRCVISEMRGLLDIRKVIPGNLLSRLPPPTPSSSFLSPSLSLPSSLNRLLVCLRWLLVNMLHYPGVDNANAKKRKGRREKREQEREIGRESDTDRERSEWMSK